MAGPGSCRFVLDRERSPTPGTSAISRSLPRSLSARSGIALPRSCTPIPRAAIHGRCGHLPGYHGGMSLAQFVLRYLPPSPARVLEIGCGPVGDLTYAIAAAGYDIIAVDPVAPVGPLFRRIPLTQAIHARQSAVETRRPHRRLANDSDDKHIDARNIYQLRLNAHGANNGKRLGYGATRLCLSRSTWQFLRDKSAPRRRGTSSFAHLGALYCAQGSMRNADSAGLGFNGYA
jgi:hypothetical protein